VDIVQGDIRKLDLQSVAATLGNGFLVVANIPYNITMPIFDLFWGSGLPVRQMSVMVQAEVADKLVALPGDSAYGLTSLRCRYYTEPAIIEHVPAEAFTPPPKVDSAFVNLPFRAAPPAPVTDEALLWRVVRAGFAQRRKTLLNALKGVAGVMPEPARAALHALGLPATVRGEAFSLLEWIAFANALASASTSQ
jgi:16S rRNA (adenine1518-N6/adenine1519-N6)-dimethyltransferase